MDANQFRALARQGEEIRFDQLPELDDRQAAAWRAFQAQFSLTSWPYYSTVKLFAEQVAAAPGGPYTWTIPAGTEVLAFAYRVGEGRGIAGFTPQDGPATIADTNLVNAGQTTSADNVLIHGIALQILPAMLHQDAAGEDADTDPSVNLVDHRQLSAIVEACSVELSLNGGTNAFRLGRIVQIPGAGGLAGAAHDASGYQGQVGAGKDLSWGQNGWQLRSNYFRVPEGLMWRRQGKPDSNLVLRFVLRRAVTIFSGGSAENQAVGGGLDLAADNAVGVVATAQPGYAYPPVLGVEILVHFLARVKGPRTRSV